MKLATGHFSYNTGGYPIPQTLIDPGKSEINNYPNSPVDAAAAARLAGVYASFMLKLAVYYLQIWFGLNGNNTN
jgi:hypothetical protein